MNKCPVVPSAFMQAVVIRHLPITHSMRHYGGRVVCLKKLKTNRQNLSWLLRESRHGVHCAPTQGISKGS